MHKNMKWYGLGGALALFAVLLVVGCQGAVVSLLDGEDLRVKGWVRAGSMHWDPRTNELAFELARKDGTEPVSVAYRGILPDMFSEGREVVVEGHYGQGALSAKQIMTSCPSKYEPQKAEPQKTEQQTQEAQPPAA